MIGFWTFSFNEPTDPSPTMSTSAVRSYGIYFEDHGNDLGVKIQKYQQVRFINIYFILYVYFT